ncbi:MAG: TolC family protein [Bacteroidetes bacterium]|uniref:TolC family protein n=1 Tax=Candidatus Egerieousia excrementavium TaxID=2840778 RepID=A0A9D9DMQ3_9BACT|nr:TolC family protein [Candidatus Egerieousia excrementavium]
MKRIYILLLLLPFQLKAQQTEDVLRAVEENNIELQALRKENEAAVLEVKSQNALESTSVEYSPFFRRGVDGVASSELVVKQGFDFPTLYAARSKSGKLQQQVLDLQYQVSRRDILLEAKLRCHDLIYFNKVEGLLEQRRKNAEELLALYDKKLEEGDATIIEVNKIKMDRMNIEKEAAEIEAEMHAAFQSLAALNGNHPVSFDAREYGLAVMDGTPEEIAVKIMESDYMLQQGKAADMASEQEVKVVKQNWIPKLEIGYRRNTDVESSSNGFMVGASLPIFSNARNVKIAKARQASARLELDNAKIATENQIYALIYQARQLRTSMEIYDTGLMYSTLEMLQKAVKAGELSIIDYYVEADSIYENLHSYLDVERAYHNAMAELYKNEL